MIFHTAIVVGEMLNHTVGQTLLSSAPFRSFQHPCTTTRLFYLRGLPRLTSSDLRAEAASDSLNIRTFAHTKDASRRHGILYDSSQASEFQNPGPLVIAARLPHGWAEIGNRSLLISCIII